MELKEFVKEILLNIATGISEAQEELYKNEKYLGIINPTKNQFESNYNYVVSGDLGQLSEVEITASINTIETKGGKVALHIASGGIENKKETLNKVSFRVPIGFPVSNLPKDYVKFE